jgi:hypothetical protein
MLLALVLAACQEREKVAAAVPETPEPPVSEFDRVMGPFLSTHWRLPVSPQGEAPADFTEVDRALDPAVCGACHPKQFAEWQTSLHSAAYGPGFSGQLFEGALANPVAIRGCQSCHAPLGEQQPFSITGAPEPAFDAALQAQGVVCPACHVRGYHYYGPPRRAELPPTPPPVPHGGFEERTEYHDSRFCASCHQFFDDPGVNGKPLENTYVEWLQSPQAAAGRVCQECHMPDRVHHWRGIHDPEIVRAAVDVDLFPLDLSGSTLQAALVLMNRDVGHAFPTYVTPRVYMTIQQVDRQGRGIEGTRLEATIGRHVDLATMSELFDTRVFPGESVKLEYNLARAESAAALQGQVTVDPDYHYRGVFASLLTSLVDARAREEIEEARRRISTSTYVLAEIRLPLPRR